MKIDDPDNRDLVKCAQDYVAASNEHDLQTIELMLAADCEYVSSGVGNHKGQKDILEMMKGFFSAYPDVSWQTSNYQRTESSVVLFDFVITLDGNSSDGKESLHFDEQGKINRIEVAR